MKGAPIGAKNSMAFYRRWQAFNGLLFYYPPPPVCYHLNLLGLRIAMDIIVKKSKNMHKAEQIFECHRLKIAISLFFINRTYCLLI
jgi:hypothetical protein